MVFIEFFEEIMDYSHHIFSEKPWTIVHGFHHILWKNHEL